MGQLQPRPGRRCRPGSRRLRAGGRGRGAEGAAEASEPVAVIEVLEASGLRGRGGAGFPTGTKWRTVAGMGGAEPVTVVVNAAEGEPGTFKDRTLLRRNPYQVLEGALIAAHAVGADRVVVGMKDAAAQERGRVEAAIGELVAAGWPEHVTIECMRGLRPLPARRGDRAPRGDQRPAAVPAPRPAVPRGGRGGRRPQGRCRRGHRRRRHPRQQRRDARQRAEDRARGPRRVPCHRHGRVAGHDRLHGQRPHARRRAWGSTSWARRCAR